MQNIKELEEKRDTLAMELFTEMKNQQKRTFLALFVSMVLNVLIVALFIWYLYQYDYVSTVEQTGVYTLVDSTGNVISSDISAEQIIDIMEIIENGNSESN